MSAPSTLVQAAHRSPPNLSPVALTDERAKQLRRAAMQLVRWNHDRNELIRLAHEEGASYREIAEHVGLSHVGVMKILKAPHHGTADPSRRAREARMKDQEQ